LVVTHFLGHPVSQYECWFYRVDDGEEHVDYCYELFWTVSSTFRTSCVAVGLNRAATKLLIARTLSITHYTSGFKDLDLTGFIVIISYVTNVLPRRLPSRFPMEAV